MSNTLNIPTQRIGKGTRRKDSYFVDEGCERELLVEMDEDGCFFWRLYPFPFLSSSFVTFLTIVPFFLHSLTFPFRTLIVHSPFLQSSKVSSFSSPSPSRSVCEPTHTHRLHHFMRCGVSFHFCMLSRSKLFCRSSHPSRLHWGSEREKEIKMISALSNPYLDSTRGTSPSTQRVFPWIAPA